MRHLRAASGAISSAISEASRRRFWRHFGRCTSRLFKRRLGDISSAFRISFQALPSAISSAISRALRMPFQALPSAISSVFRALRHHLDVVSGAISAHSWVWLRGVSSSMPSGIKRCTEDVISSTFSGAVSDAASSLYRAILSAVSSAVLARVRAPSWAQFRAPFRRGFDRRLGAVFALRAPSSSISRAIRSALRVI